MINTTGYARSTVEYHLRRLSRGGHVIATNVLGHRAYYREREFHMDLREVIPLVRSHRTLLTLLARGTAEGWPVHRIAAWAGVSHQKAGKLLQFLQGLGVVSITTQAGAGRPASRVSLQSTRAQNQLRFLLGFAPERLERRDDA